jgi:putative hemolysin
MIIEAAIVLLLILANGFFAASEIAVVSSRKGRLVQQAQLGQHNAAVALELAENPNHFLSTVQVGITLISTFAAAFGGASIAEVLAGILRSIPALARYADNIALGVVVLVISYFSLILGELVPKRLALQNAEGVASAVAPIMRTAARLAGPIVRFLTFSTELVLRLLGRHNMPETPITEDDIMALVHEGAVGGTVEAAEEDLITSVFTFTDRTVRSLMTPRTQLVAVAIGTPFPQVLRAITDSGYSRIPVYQDTLDQIVGVLYVKDLLRAWGHPHEVDVGALLRPPLYVLEGQRAVVALQQLKQHQAGMALVLDEYGQVAGLIALEDMLEALVGDIADEYDEANEAFVQRDDGSYLVDGLLPFSDLQQRIALPAVDALLHEYAFETVAGFMLALLGHIPVVGERAHWHGYAFEVVDMDERRIDKILIQPPTLRPGEQTEGVLSSGAVLPPP